jgi:hypothetical protein
MAQLAKSHIGNATFKTRPLALPKRFYGLVCPYCAHLQMTLQSSDPEEIPKTLDESNYQLFTPMAPLIGHFLPERCKMDEAKSFLLLTRLQYIIFFSYSLPASLGTDPTTA